MVIVKGERELNVGQWIIRGEGGEKREMELAGKRIGQDRNSAGQQ